MRTKAYWAFVLIFASVCLLFYLSVFRNQLHRTKQRDAVSCRLKWFHQAQFAGLYVAQSKGFFNDAGINCTLRPGGQDFNAIKLVAAGSDDFGVWDAGQVIIARSQGIPIVAIAVIFQESPVCFFSRKNSGIRTPRDFIGKKVAMQYGTNVRTEYIAMMKRAGVDLGAVTEVPSRYDLQRFLVGSVDIWNGYTINEPIVAEAHGVPVHLIKPSDYGIDMYADCIITTNRMVKEKPHLVLRFVRAAVRGWEYALAHRKEAVRIVLAQDSRLSEDHERKMLDESARLIFARTAKKRGIGFMDEFIWRKMLEELRSQSLLGPHSVVLSKIYTNRFLPGNLDGTRQTGGSRNER